MKRLLSTTIFTMVLAAGTALPEAVAADLRTTGGPPESFRKPASVSEMSIQTQAPAMEAALIQTKSYPAAPLAIEAQSMLLQNEREFYPTDCNFMAAGRTVENWLAREAYHNCKFGL